MRTSIAQKIGLQQKLSPQQIQLMKLLQIPAAMLDQRIKEELEANPALEEGNQQEVTDNEFDNNDADVAEGEVKEETYELDDYLNEYIEDDPAYYQNNSSYNPDDDDKTIPIAVERSLQEYLEEQLGLLRLASEEQEAIALQLIGSIDEDGYLRRETDSIVDDLMFSQNIFTTEDKILKVLKQIQSFEPPGIGARDLQECLLIQLRLKKENWTEFEDDEPEAINLAIKILKKYFDAFSKKHFDKLIRQLNISEEELKEAMNVILTLNPKPASGYSAGNLSRSNQYVIPDFIVENKDDELSLRLNARNAPELRISDHFREMLRANARNGSKKKASKTQKETLKFVRNKVESAKWFIDAIRQRHETLYKTMYAILQYQYDFFLTGDERRLRPMILQDIADITGLDVSTVSRVANSKFVQTEYGTRSLKSFFSESLQNTDGEEVSTLEVKNILGEVVANENKRKPLSDEKLSAILKEKGYKVARRTIAKYRDQLNIPKASLRKEL